LGAIIYERGFVMRILTKDINIDFSGPGELELILHFHPTDSLLDELYGMKEFADCGHLIEAEIKKYRFKRSLDSNAYLWVLLDKMAQVLHSEKDDLYLTMLGRYGVFTHIIVKPDAEERIKQEYKLVRSLGSVLINGQKGVQLQCYFGSSTYDTKEMSVLIDGVVNECKDLGIETLTPDELERMGVAWGKKHGN
jgi:hypothetical protein